MRRSKRLLLILLPTACLIGLVVGWNGWIAELRASRYQKQLASVSDNEAGALLRRARKLGKPGIAVLVEALGSDRRNLARAAKRELHHALSNYATLRAAESSPHLAVLADELARRVDDFNLSARCDAADLASRILSWPLDAKAVNRTQVFASCERVLRATRLEGRVRAARRQPARGNRTEPFVMESQRLTSASNNGNSQIAAQDSDPAEAEPDQPPAPKVLSFSGDNIARMSRLPGGGLPIETLPIPELSNNKPAEPSIADARPSEPRPLSAAPEAVPLEPVAPPTVSANNGSGVSGPQAGSGFAKVNSAAMKTRETVELMRNLQGGESRRARGSRDELVRRGFTELQLDLARRAFDPDPEVRKQLARSMPALRSVNPAPWLILLSRDADADVRLLAITLLATTADPAVLEQVEQVARKDSDSRIRRQAKRISQRGRSTLH